MMNSRSSYRWWDWLSVLLLVIALLTAATRLYATHWTVYLERVQYLVLLGTIAGLALGFSRFTPMVVKWIGFGYTLFAIPWQLGGTLASELPWSDRLWILITRISAATSDFANKHPVHDPILFLALMAILFWLIGLVGGYCLVRYGQVWPAILPAGIALIVINHYDPGLSSWARYIGIYVFASLLLLGRMTYLRYRAEWQASGVSQSPGTGGDFSRAALMAVVVLVLFAWTIPAIGQTLSPASQMWVEVSKPFDTFRKRISEAFSSLQSSVGSVSDVYGSSMSLGTGTHLGDSVVFTVRASSVPPAGMRYYWKARTYDVYQDWNWSTSINDNQPVVANGPAFHYPTWKDRQEVSFTFTTSVTLGSTLYVPSTPLQVGRSGSAMMATLPDGTADVEFISANPPLSSGQSYTVTSWISSPTIADMTASGSDYPQYIKDHYLQLPDKLSPKFATLAKQITVGLTTPYDKANAITQYLRRTMTYSDTIPDPPSGQDPVEWFLFNYKKGFCNYYASSEVLLLRTLGIPARLAVGYAEGQSLNNQASGLPGEGQPGDNYIVRNKDSHAWPEVYFNGIGWIEFEPTVSQPTLSPPTGAGNQQKDLPSGAQANRTLQNDLRGIDPVLNVARNAATAIVQTSQTPTFWIGLSAALSAIAGLAWAYRTKQPTIPILPVWLDENLTRRGMRVPRWLKRWAQWTLFSPLQRAYGVINQALALLGHPARPSQTPSERTASLGRLLPQASQPAQILLAEYEHAQYGRRAGDVDSARQASQQVRVESWKAFFRKLLRR